MLTAYLLCKSLHVVGFVSWFAAMFFLVRLFVNHVEANAKAEPERGILLCHLIGMEDRVYRIIMRPALVLTLVCGFSMIFINPDLIHQNWLQAKLVLLAGLVGYNFWCKKIMADLAANRPVFDSFGMRLFNEVPTLFLVAIVLLAVFKNGLNPFWGTGGLAAFAGLMWLGASKYRKNREG